MSPKRDEAHCNGAQDSCLQVQVEEEVSLSHFQMKGRDLTVLGHPILHQVPSNITLTPASASASASASAAGAFLGFDGPDAKSHHVAPLGCLEGIRFMSLFRFKVWWSTHWVGDRGSDLEHETQLLLLDRSASSGRPYVALLPIIEGPFRASLQPGARDFVDLCVESGSTQVAASSFRTVLYLHAGDDPYAVLRDAVAAVQRHLGTFKTMEPDQKTPPGIVDKFGWCTWDAFYLKVHPQGIREGVGALSDGGCPPGFVLIDDGWQSICHDEDDPATGQEGMNRTHAGEQMPCRLIKFEENHKFREYRSNKDDAKTGLGAFVGDLKEAFPTVDYVYVWHALCGYWGGVRPRVPGLPAARVVKPRLTPGLEKTMEDLAVDKIVNNGVGLVEPAGGAQEMYQGLHSHLKASGIDGVKVDVIHVLEMLCEEYGGRVELAKGFYAALSESVKKHFHGNGVIASMEHCNDFMLLGTDAISLGRVGDDFWCADPSGDPNGTWWLQGCHMVHCAYNSLWMAHFIHPDWDMFQSTHPCAAFHAASRAVSGGPVYVSDSVGNHDFDLLRSLALPDGTILRCDHHALPTRDCLFQDPLHDGNTVLKIWNLNKYGGVLGAFNCQGGGWCREARRNKCASQFSRRLTARARPSDIEWNKGKTHPLASIEEGTVRFAAYSHRSKQLTLLKPDQELEITLDPFDYELVAVAPIRHLRSHDSRVEFAPIGLVNMLNSGGAVQLVELGEANKEVPVAKVHVKGAGELRAYSSVRPVACRVNGKEVEFVYEASMVCVQVPWSGSSAKLCHVEYLY